MRDSLLADLDAKVARLGDIEIDGLVKGVPAGVRVRIAEVGAQGWNVLRGDLPFPLLTLDWKKLEHNARVLQGVSDRAGAWFAPHGKTTMSPQIFREQLRQGAWAISVANLPQLQVAVAFGVPRILVANQLTSDHDLKFIASAHAHEQGPEIYLLADDPGVVRRLEAAMRESGARRPARILVEVRPEGGRAGVRTIEGLRAVASTIAASPELLFAGVEGYEGSIPGTVLAERLQRTDAYLLELAAVARTIAAEYPSAPFLISCGGSLFFDRVLEHLGRQALSFAQLVIRPGMYITSDAGKVDALGPLGSGPRRLAGPGLQPALEIWSAVVSRPEPDLAILGMGKRDVPSDPWMPKPLRWFRPGSAPEAVGTGAREWEVSAVHDQHAYLNVPEDAPLRPGDLVSCGIPHACGAFERWQVIMTVDESGDVTGAVRTFF